MSIRAVCIVGAILASVTPAAADDCDTHEHCVASCKAGKTKSCEVIRTRLGEACESTQSKRACAAAGEIYQETISGMKVDLAKAYKYLKIACDADDGGSCSDLGLLLVNGTGVTRDEKAGIATWEKACTLDSPIGCANYGGRLANGRGIARDAAKAAQILEKGCRLNLGLACRMAGDLHADGINGFVDSEAVERLYIRACDLGARDGCSRAAAYGYQPAIASAVEDAAARYAVNEASCANGLYIACDEQAERLLHGDGTNRDVRKGLALYDRICKLEYAPGCEELGEIYLAGALAKKDVKRGAKYLARACDLGNSKTCRKLGELYERGKAIKRNPKKSASAFAKGCQLNDPQSCTSLGAARETGTGTKVDLAGALDAYAAGCSGGHRTSCIAGGALAARQEDPRADDLFRSACAFHDAGACEETYKRDVAAAEKRCEANDAEGCAVAGRAYASGRGVAVDAVKGAELAKRSCDAGSHDGCGLYGEALVVGHGVTADLASGVALLEKACTAGSGQACGFLGWSYSLGKHGLNNNEKAGSALEPIGLRLRHLRRGPGKLARSRQGHEPCAAVSRSRLLIRLRRGVPALRPRHRHAGWHAGHVLPEVVRSQRRARLRALRRRVSRRIVRGRQGRRGGQGVRRESLPARRQGVVHRRAVNRIA
jgi:TPR repeat protein